MKKAIYCMLCLMLLSTACLAEEENIRIRLTFAGDVTLGSEEYLWDKPFSLVGYAKEHGYDYFLNQVEPLFEMDDLTIVNLEGVLSDSAEDENKEKTYRFRGPTDFAQILTAGSVEMVGLANNHTLDYGERGYVDTCAALDDAGILRFGGGRVAVVEIKGMKLAFIGLSYTQDCEAERTWLKNEIAQLKGETGVSAVIFTYHGGTEYSEVRSEKQEAIARLAVDAGADLVVMHHPHVVQGMDVRRNRTILYSLGNFCFGGNKNVRAMQSLVAVADLTFSPEGKYLGQQIDLYPAHISGTEQRSNYQPLLVSGADAKRVMRLVQQDTDFELEPFDEAVGYARQMYLPAE